MFLAADRAGQARPRQHVSLALKLASLWLNLGSNFFLAGLSSPLLVAGVIVVAAVWGTCHGDRAEMSAAGAFWQH